MRISVDATCWHNMRGYGRHARALLSALLRIDQHNQYTLFFDIPDPQIPGNCEVVCLDSQAPTVTTASANGHRSAADMWRMSRALVSRRCDVLLYPTVYSYVPTLSRARKLIMIHDVIAETFPSLTLPRRSSRLLWNIKVALGRWQADALVTVSDYSRERIVKHFGARPERVFVVGEASDPIFKVIPEARPTPQLEAAGIVPDMRFVCYVGGFGPHKNLESLLRAFAALSARPDLADVRLVMVGEYRREVFHSCFETLAALAGELGIRDRVIFTGFVPDEELVILLNMARVLVLPSLMEGFGLPAVEAAACGCPVVATTASPLPELLGEAGVFLKPSAENLEAALCRVLRSDVLRASMRDAGIAAAARLTWDAAARQMMDVFDRVGA